MSAQPTAGEVVGALATEVARLRTALREAGEAIVAAHHAGFDSDRLRIATAAVEAITAALDGGEQHG